MSRSDSRPPAVVLRVVAGTALRRDTMAPGDDPAGTAAGPAASPADHAPPPAAGIPPASAAAPARGAWYPGLDPGTAAWMGLGAVWFEASVRCWLGAFELAAAFGPPVIAGAWRASPWPVPWAGVALPAVAAHAWREEAARARSALAMTGVWRAS